MMIATARAGIRTEPGVAVEEIVPIPSHDDERRKAMDVVARFGPPAYLRRAKRVEEAFDALLAQLRGQRDQWLDGVRLHLSLLLDLAGSFDALRPCLAEEQVDRLRAWARDFGLAERAGAGAARWRLRRALRDLAASVARFNRRWLDFVARADLTEVNAEREGYNRWYLLEKECAVGVIRARQRFQPLEPITIDDLRAALPPLPELRVGRDVV
jgi:hypothetical protein